MHGAWQCPDCDNLVRKWKLFCERSSCGARRPLLQDFEDGDWFCYVCGHHNFKRKKACAWRDCPTMLNKPGDWDCGVCGNHNFARREICNSRGCSAPRRL
jgi:predicted nucleic-acid-binding Zn-ribbon protein